MLEDKIETFISCPGGTYNLISTGRQIEKQELPVICAFPWEESQRDHQGIGGRFLEIQKALARWGTGEGDTVSRISRLSTSPEERDGRYAKEHKDLWCNLNPGVGKGLTRHSRRSGARSLGNQPIPEPWLSRSPTDIPDRAEWTCKQFIINLPRHFLFRP